MTENHILAMQVFAQQKHLQELGVIQLPHYTISYLILSTGVWGPGWGRCGFQSMAGLQDFPRCFLLWPLALPRPLGHPDLPPAHVVIIMAAHKHMAGRILLHPPPGVIMWAEGPSCPLGRRFQNPCGISLFLSLCHGNRRFSQQCLLRHHWVLKGETYFSLPAMDTESDLETDLDCLGSETCSII